MEHARPPPELAMDGSPVSRADAWKRWKTQFQLFLKASGVNKEEAGVQASLLINLIGPDGFDVYQTFSYQTDESSDDVKIVMKKFDEYFGTKPNITLSRYNFFTRNQEPGESVNQYVTALKLLSKNCEFSTLVDGLIRDRVVCGIRNAVVRDRMLRTDDLTLEKAIRICTADEVSSDGSRQLERGAGQGSTHVDAIAARGGRGATSTSRRPWHGRGRGRPADSQARGAYGGPSSGNFDHSVQGLKVCVKCGSSQCQPGACAASAVKCFECQKTGHFARMCKLNSVTRKIYDVEYHEGEVKDTDSEDENSELFYISTILSQSQCKQKSEEWFETLYCKGGLEKFKLDTGADINVLSYEKFLILGFNPAQINKANIKLESYSGDFIPIKGICSLNWNYKNQLYSLNFAIANMKCQSILGRKSCQELGVIKRVNTVNLIEYNDLFQGLGCLPGIYHIDVDPTVKPIVCAPRKVPFSLRDRLHAELNKMIDLGVIRKVSHPTSWVNALVIAAKKDNGIRICLDPRPLNQAIRRAHFQLPTITDLATRLQGCCFFSVLDAHAGFWMQRIDDDSADLCTFATPFGRYQFLRLPYGINCASEVFHGRMRQLLEDLEGVDSFVDDIIVFGKTREEHDNRLLALLNRARQINLKFNKEKCKLGVKEVTYLGHVFDKNGMRADNNKIRAITEMKPPTDKKALQRFLGAVNFLAKFIQNYSNHAIPLNNLLKKDVSWCWEDEHQRSFDVLRTLVSRAPVLALYDPTLPVVVSVDASAAALGAVLLQDGRVLEYASRTLTDTQTRYAQIEKELLAIVFACEKFHQYLFGKSKVLVESDHKPLESIFKKPLMSVPVRLQRMMLKVQGYDLIVSYKPGRLMYVPDTLSRAALPELYNSDINENVLMQVHLLVNNLNISTNKLTLIKTESRKDQTLCTLINVIKNGWPKYKCDLPGNVYDYWSYKEELFVIDDVVFKGDLVVIPMSMRKDMLKCIHEGHLGIDRCKRRARDVIFWPGISNDVENFVQRCRVCQENANAPCRETLLPIEVPSLPWYKLGSDIFEYGKKYYLILVDYYSNYIEVSALNNICSQTIINSMKEMFARHGIPEILITDNGTQYSSYEFKKFTDEWGFKHLTSSPHYPQANGKSERAVQTVKRLLIKSLQSNTDFQLSLLNFRNTPRDGLDSPGQLLMSRRLNCKLPVKPELLKPKVSDTEKQYKTMLQKQNKCKQNYDAKSKNQHPLNVGDDVVLIQGQTRSRGTVIAHSNMPRSYIVQNKMGAQYRRNRRHLIKCIPPGPEPDKHNDDAYCWRDAEDSASPAPAPRAREPADEPASGQGTCPASTSLTGYSPPLTRSKAKKLGNN